MAITYPNKTHASEHFTWRELACKCGRCTIPARVRVNLATQAAHLELLRAALGGGPLNVFSAYRCPAHNKAVGGAPQSEHMDGTATDIGSKTHTPAEVAAAAEKIPAFANGGIGRYAGFTHVDSRGYKARW